LHRITTHVLSIQLKNFVEKKQHVTRKKSCYTNSSWMTNLYLSNGNHKKCFGLRVSERKFVLVFVIYDIIVNRRWSNLL